MRGWLLILFAFSTPCGMAQTLGGNAVFGFVRQPQSTQVAALGGINVSTISSDVSLAFANPALLRQKHHGQINAAFFNFKGGLSQYSLTAAYRAENIKTNIGVGLQRLDYGQLAQTDAAGNMLGSFSPSDMALQLMFSRQHKDNWHYGATLKWLQSNYGWYKSSGLAADVALTYVDTVNLLQLAIVVKNMGTTLTTFEAGTPGEMPFDVQFGITKRLAKAPIQFSLTAHQLHRFNIYYKDTLFLQEEGEDLLNDKKNTAEKILAHLVIATQIFVNEKIELNVGYNFLRRQSLNALNAANGLNGFTLGAGLVLKKMQIRYAAGFYQQRSFHQFGINTTLY
jgi:hypothetical protein